MYKIQKERYIYIDFLKVVVIFAVVLAHVSISLSNWKEIEQHFELFLYINSTTRFNVPLFILCSGAMVLRKPVDDIGEFFHRRFSRVVIPFLFWSVFYKLNIIIHDELELSFVDILHDFFYQEIAYHFWFIYMILAVYLFVPLLSDALTKFNQTKLNYLIGLWIFFSCIVSIEYLYNEGDSTKFWLMEYIGYFLAGWFIHNHKVKLIKLNGYVTFSICLAITVILTKLVMIYKADYGIYYEAVFEPYFILVVIGSLLIFRYFRDKEDFFRRHEKVGKNFSKLSALTYGAYLVHPLILEFLQGKFFLHNGFYYLENFPVTTIVIFSAVTGIISFLITAVFHNLPYLRRLV